MAVNMRVYEDIVSKACDMSATHMEHERTIEEVGELLSRLKLEASDAQLLALARYVAFSQSRRADQDFNTYHPAAQSY